MTSNRPDAPPRSRRVRHRTSSSADAQREPPHWEGQIEVDNDSCSEGSEGSASIQRITGSFNRPRRYLSVSPDDQSSSEDSHDDIFQYNRERRKPRRRAGPGRTPATTQIPLGSERGSQWHPISVSSDTEEDVIDTMGSGSCGPSARLSRSTPSPFEECFSPVLSPDLTQSYEVKKRRSATMYRPRSQCEDSDFINDNDEDEDPPPRKRRRNRLRPMAARPERVLAAGDGVIRVEGAAWPKSKPNTVRGIAVRPVSDRRARQRMTLG